MAKKESKNNCLKAINNYIRYFDKLIGHSGLIYNCALTRTQGGASAPPLPPPPPLNETLMMHVILIDSSCLRHCYAAILFLMMMKHAVQEVAS